MSCFFSPLSGRGAIREVEMRSTRLNFLNLQFVQS